MPRINIPGVAGVVDLDAEVGSPEFDAAVDEIHAKHAAPQPQLGPPAPGTVAAKALERGRGINPSGQGVPDMGVSDVTDAGIPAPGPAPEPPPPAGQESEGESPLAETLRKTFINAPIALKNKFEQGISSVVPALWNAGQNVVGTGMQAIGLTPATPSPQTGLDKAVEEMRQRSQAYGQAPEVQELQQGPGIAGPVGRTLGTIAELGGQAPALANPLTAAGFGGAQALEAANEQPIPRGETPTKAAQKAMGHAAVNAALYSGLGSRVVQGATPEAVAAGTGLRGAAARTTTSAGETALMIGGAEAANKLIDGASISEAIKAGAAAAPEAALLGGFSSVMHAPAHEAHAQELARGQYETPRTPEPEAAEHAAPEQHPAPEGGRPGPEAGGRAEAGVGVPPEVRAPESAPAEAGQPGRSTEAVKEAGPEVRAPEDVKAPEPARGPEDTANAPPAAAGDDASRAPVPDAAEPARGQVPQGVDGLTPPADEKGIYTGPERRHNALGQDETYQHDRRAQKPGTFIEPRPDAEPDLDVEGMMAKTVAPEDAPESTPAERAIATEQVRQEATPAEPTQDVEGMVAKTVAPEDAPESTPAEQKITVEQIKTETPTPKPTYGIEKVPISELWSDPEEVTRVKKEVMNGQTSKTPGLPDVWFDDKTGKYIIEDGSHRTVQAMLRGETHINAMVRRAPPSKSDYYNDSVRAKASYKGFGDNTNEATNKPQPVSEVAAPEGAAPQGRPAAAEEGPVQPVGETRPAGDGRTPADGRTADGQSEPDAGRARPEQPGSAVEKGIEEKRHLDAATAARDRYLADHPNDQPMKAALEKQVEEHRMVHEDATYDPEHPRNAREAEKSLAEVPGADPRATARAIARVNANAEIMGVKSDDLWKGLRITNGDIVDAKTGDVLHQMTPTDEELEKRIAPEEVAAKGQQRRTIFDRARDLLNDKDLADYVAAARAGRSMRGWYKYSGAVLKHIFGPDYQRFVGVLAATSPRQPVGKNLAMALEVWKTWVDAGRPTDEKALYKLFGPVAKAIQHPVTGKMYRPWKAVDMEARGPNTIRALMDPSKRLSGPKVEPFRRNILGDEYPVTNDSWQAKILDMAQHLFSTKYGNVAATHVTRRVAEELGWQPREAQETMWSFFKTLSELNGEKGDPHETLRRLTHGDIVKNAESFAHLLEDPDVQAVLKKLGYDTSNLPKFEHAEQFDPGARVLTEEGTDPARLERMAQRAREVRDTELKSKDREIPDAPKLSVFHASPEEGLTQILPEKQGTGQIGAEKKRMQTADNWTNYSHLYTNEPGTDVENARFGGKHIYQTELPLTNAPGGLIHNDFRGDRSYADLKQAGYSGVYYPTDHNGPGQVHTFNPTDVDYAGKASVGGKPIMKAPEFLAGVRNVGKAISDAHIDSIDEKTGNGGSTTNPLTGKTLKAGVDDGYVVSPYKELESTLDHAPTPKEVADYIKDPRVIDKLGEHSRNQIGTWADGEGNHVLDVSRHVDTFEEAQKIGKANNQKEYYDVKNDRSIPVDQEPGQTLYQRGPRQEGEDEVGTRTDTPAFKRWFGASKVVDKSGEPLAVYHGTSSPDLEDAKAMDQWAFDPKAAGAGSDHPSAHIGFFFSSKPKGADTWGTGRLKTYLSLKNPYVMSGKDFSDQVVHGGYTRNDSLDFRQRLKDDGFDGLHIKNWNKGEDWYVALDPEQVKSTNNAGKWNPKDPRILHQGGEEPKASITFGQGEKGTGRWMQFGPDADATSIDHEFTHDAQDMLWNGVKRMVADGKAVPERARKIMEPLNDLVGAKWGDDWTTAQKEQLAEAAEQHHQTGDAATPELKTAFEKLKDFFRKAYAHIKGSAVENDLPQNVRDALDEWTKPEAQRAAEREKEVGQPAKSLGAAAEGDAFSPQHLSRVLDEDPGAMKKLWNKLGELKDAAGNLGAPMHASDQTKAAGGILNETNAVRSLDTLRSQKKLKAALLGFDALPTAKQSNVFDKMEAGDKQDTPELQQMADTVRKELDQRRDGLMSRGLLDDYITNYLPHQYKNEAVAASVFGRGTGAPGFTKERTFLTRKEAVASGLTPKFDNPAEAAMAHIAEADRYMATADALRTMEKNGVIQRYSKDSALPTKTTDGEEMSILDPKFNRQAGLKNGEYLAGETNVSKLLDTQGSTGPENNPIYKTMRLLNNSANQMQLLGLFHASTTSSNAFMTRLGLGLQEFTRGATGADVKEGGQGRLEMMGQGAKHIATSPWAAASYLKRGRELAKAAYSDADVPPEIKDLLMAGHHFDMDRQYATDMSLQFRRAMVRGDKLGVLGKALPATLDTLTKPLMEYFIPAVKTGATAELIESELARLGPKASDTAKRYIATRVQETVDDRFGQLRYDNNFWNKNLKGMAQIIMRAPGWAIGTVRQYGGGVKDYAGLLSAKRRAGGDTVDPLVTSRMAYIPATLIGSALIGSVYHYLKNDKDNPIPEPEGLKDRVFPLTGGTNLDLSPERYAPAGYAKEMYGYSQQPFQTIAGKVSPLLTLASQGLSGKNYFGQPYRDPQSSPWDKAADTAKFMLSQLVPISARQYAPDSIREDKGPNEDSNIPWYERQVGAPAPSFISNPAKTDEADTKAYHAAEVRRLETNSKWEDRLRKAYAAKDTVAEKTVNDELDQAVAAGKITEEQADALSKRADRSTSASKFSRLPLTQAVPAFEHMTPEKRDEMTDILDKKAASFEKKPDEGVPEAKRKELLKRVDQLLGP